MCCTGTHTMHHCHGHHTQMHHGHCGCGRHSGGRPAVKLENYKAYLEAELKSVEARLAASTKD